MTQFGSPQQDVAKVIEDAISDSQVSADHQLAAVILADAPLTDLEQRTPEQLAAVVVSLEQLAARRSPGQSQQRVWVSDQGTDGWQIDRTQIALINDDMPFLYDSLMVALTNAGYRIAFSIHPILKVQRDDAGQFVSADAAADQWQGSPESWIYVELAEVVSQADLPALSELVANAMHDVHVTVADFAAMKQQIRQVAEEVETLSVPTVSPEDAAEAAAFLRWLLDDNFVMLGYREYRLEGTPGADDLVSLPATGLGILRQSEPTRTALSTLPQEVQDSAHRPEVLVLTKANSRATVHRNAYLDYIGVKQFAADGTVIGEKRIIGLLAATMYSSSVEAIPVIRQKVARALDMSGLPAQSHGARDLLHFAETYPRDELLQITATQLHDLAREVSGIGERRQTRLFLRNDEFGRFVSALVYLPRDRYTTAVRLAITEELRRAFDPASVEYVARVSESVLARLHFVVRMHPGQQIPDVDPQALAERVAAATHTWDDTFIELLGNQFGAEMATSVRTALGEEGVSDAYKEDVAPAVAIADILTLISIDEAQGEIARLHTAGTPIDQLEAPSDPLIRRFTLYRRDRPVDLYEIMPIFASLGVQVLEERPYEFTMNDGTLRWLYDVVVRLPGDGTQDLPDRFAHAFTAGQRGEVEIDRLNQLVTGTHLSVEQVSWVRAWITYVRQIGSPFSMTYIEQVVDDHSEIVSGLVDLFEVRFDPTVPEGDREVRAEQLTTDLTVSIDAVTSLDADRILRQLLSVVNGILRTNAFSDHGRDRQALAFKLAPRTITGVPAPQPLYEISVTSSRVHGVHLRFGSVARGGLRWSDRPEDVRTEILGLVKAQEVKNAVIVPVGAKGGFVVKQPVTGSRGEVISQGQDCYREFINALLDVTDNLVDGQVVPPSDTVRRDGDDTYLVVAADKGTATFSDLANEIAQERGFWLADAFASGGSHGYDHKEMGITAKGAWESVRRHFRELGVDVQTDRITTVGIGDMSGDVFGNGMLCSSSLALVAAFDHRHIFLDPYPDPAASFTERQRVAELPRSSWMDYDQSLISAGGGVYPRDAKTVALSDEVIEVLGLPSTTTSLTPDELIHAVLTAPVDLLWNGGIGTYVKASSETNADCGDKANDAVRINGDQLRVRVVGEGGNLGFTQLGRIAAAQAGVRINTDAIDNSAGVDCSDHEVNIKIALNSAVSTGLLTFDERNEFLASMTDDVAHLVLRDNYRQNAVLGASRVHAPELLQVHERLMEYLEGRGLLDRELEFLPSPAEVQQRLERGEGLVSPELCVLLSYVKIALTRDLVESDFAEQSWFTHVLHSYFPQAMQERFAQQIDEHPLRKEIICTVVSNDIVDSAGLTFVYRAIEETGAGGPEIVRAYTVAREVFNLRDIWWRIRGLDGQIPPAAQDAMLLEVRRLLDRSTRWVLSLRGGTVDVAGEIERFGPIVDAMRGDTSHFLVGSERSRLQAKARTFIDLGAPEDLAYEVSGSLDLFSLLDIQEIATRYDVEPEEVAELYFAISEHYGIDRLLERISDLPRDDRWSNLARASLRSDLYSVLASLTTRVLRATSAEDPAESRLAQWEAHGEEGQARARSTLQEISASGVFDLATISVAVRVLRTLITQGAGASNE